MLLIERLVYTKTELLIRYNRKDYGQYDQTESSRLIINRWF